MSMLSVIVYVFCLVGFIAKTWSGPPGLRLRWLTAELLYVAVAGFIPSGLHNIEYLTTLQSELWTVLFSSVCLCVYGQHVALTAIAESPDSSALRWPLVFGAFGLAAILAVAITFSVSWSLLPLY